MEDNEKITGGMPEEDIAGAAEQPEAVETEAEAEKTASDAYDEFQNTMGELRAESEAAEVKAEKQGSELVEWIKDIIIAVILAALIYQVAAPTIVNEHSMDDTLQNKNYLIMWKLPYKWLHKTPEYGDIIIFQSNLDLDDGSGKKLLIKRVIGIEGDTVAVRDGVVYRNGEALDEPYTKDGYTNGAMDETVVPEGKLFVLGDNRLVSVDSRSADVGFVDEDTVVGKAVLRLLPLNEIGGLYDNYVDSTADGRDD